MPTIPVRRRRINARAVCQQARQLLSTLPALLEAEPLHADADLLRAAVRYHDIISTMASIFDQFATLETERDRTAAIIPLERRSDRECLVAAATRAKTMVGHRARAAMLVLADETLLPNTGLPPEQLLAALLTDLASTPEIR